MMQIIYAQRIRWQFSFDGTKREKITESVSQGQIKKDTLPLTKAYAKACREEPTFQFFGGVIRIGDRHYQVV